jgi:ferritin
MVKSLNEQINKEIYSAYLYLSMSSYCTFKGWDGFANWFMVQYQEEMTHAMKIYNYVNDQGGRVELMKIEKPPSEFGSPLEMFEKTLEHEKFVTQCINDLVDLADEENDHPTEIFLQWYVTEQVEEEANDNEIISKLKLVGEEGNGLFMIDKELGTRVFKPTTPSQEN